MISLINKIIVIAVIASLVIACILSGCSKQSDAVIIGECNLLKGQTTDNGKSIHEGIVLAIEEINERGGLLGKKVRLKTEDNQGNSLETRKAFTKLINDGSIAIIGEIDSTAASIAASSKIPMITPVASNPKITQSSDYVFRVPFTDDFQGAVCATFARDHLKAGRAAIFRDATSDYSKRLADAFRKTFETNGGIVVADSTYNQKDTDFKSQLTIIKSKKPDIIFIPGYHQSVSKIAVQARNLGINVTLLGGDGWDSPSLIASAGRALDNCYFSNHFTSLDDKPTVEQFLKSFRAKYHKDPNSFSALGYDGAWILAEAIKKAGSTDGDAVRKAISETKDYPGVTGRITIDANRNASKPAVIIKIKGDKFVPVTTITPEQAK